jgi:hypothetical protein
LNYLPADLPQPVAHSFLQESRPSVRRFTYLFPERWNLDKQPRIYIRMLNHPLRRNVRRLDAIEVGHRCKLMYCHFTVKFGAVRPTSVVRPISCRPQPHLQRLHTLRPALQHDAVPQDDVPREYQLVNPLAELLVHIGKIHDVGRSTSLARCGSRYA